MNTEDDEFKRIEREQAMRGVPDPIHHTDKSESLEYITGWNDCRQAMLAEQPAQQEPVAWMHKIDLDRDDKNDFMAYYKRTPGYCIPLYTTPQAQPAQRTWVGLTDEEIAHIADSEWEEAFVRMIEAKLKEKNNG